MTDRMPLQTGRRLRQTAARAMKHWRWMKHRRRFLRPWVSQTGYRKSRNSESETVGSGGLQCKERCRCSRQGTICGSGVKVKRSPIREHHTFASLTVIGFQVGPTSFAIIDSKPVLSFCRQDCQAMVVGPLAERASDPRITPARGATSAHEKTDPGGIGAGQLRHNR